MDIKHTSFPKNRKCRAKIGGLQGLVFPSFRRLQGRAKGLSTAIARPFVNCPGPVEKGWLLPLSTPTIPEKGALENGKSHRRRGKNPSGSVGFRQIARNKGRPSPRKTAKKRGVSPLHFGAMQALKLPWSLHNIHIPSGCRRLQIPVFHRFNLFSTERFHTFHRVFH
ncbi:hypothetical protein [Bittarella massiliensis (ex Durand et al. 2017)]|uniref:hypothetical protein n=1 Tax=Bittarella massiliensis (ex Durand et al. 2017) TaxID=1720313 RepID=UPI001AA13EFB|nr:hypothetical protein [Bittarella massiliensis (ex Durand et al. 2017)]MBO1680694.1 hypothetical protein [Bittarella massiliensis (ex Durand et al. 2017)]